MEDITIRNEPDEKAKIYKSVQGEGWNDIKCARPGPSAGNTGKRQCNDPGLIPIFPK